jgi:hypothetical protein
MPRRLRAVCPDLNSEYPQCLDSGQLRPRVLGKRKPRNPLLSPARVFAQGDVCGQATGGSLCCAITQTRFLASPRITITLRPSFLPFAFAFLSPGRTRSRISSRSNSAMLAKIPKISRAVWELVDFERQPSCRLRARDDVLAMAFRKRAKAVVGLECLAERGGGFRPANMVGRGERQFTG